LKLEKREEGSEEGSGKQSFVLQVSGFKPSGFSPYELALE
jgi:hypothetical protein